MVGGTYEDRRPGARVGFEALMQQGRREPHLDFAVCRERAAERKRSREREKAVEQGALFDGCGSAPTWVPQACAACKKSAHLG